MTRARVDLHTPAELTQSYVDEIDHELHDIDERTELIRLEWMTLEDRRTALLKVRTRHVAARQAFTPPATLTDLVAAEGSPA